MIMYLVCAYNTLFGPGTVVADAMQAIEGVQKCRIGRKISGSVSLCVPEHVLLGLGLSRSMSTSVILKFEIGCLGAIALKTSNCHFYYNDLKKLMILFLDSMP